jgi:hypothetical protein
VAEESEATGKKGVKKKPHTPGRDHTRKSGPRKKKRFQKKAKKKCDEKKAELAEQWKVWDGLSDAAKALRPELKPMQERPKDDN